MSSQNVLASLQRSLTGALPDGNICISPKALAGTLLGAAAGAAVAYAMCKSEEDSARAEERAALMHAGTRRRASAGEEAAATRRVSLRRIEPAPELVAVGTQTFMQAASHAPSRRESPVEYVQLVAASMANRSCPTVLSARSVREPSPREEDQVPVTVSRAQSTYEAPRSSAPSVSKSTAKSEASSRHSKKSSSGSSSHRSKSKAPERRSIGLPDISETEQLGSSARSSASRHSKKTSHSHHSKHSSRHRREAEDAASDDEGTVLLEKQTIVPDAAGTDDDRDTVVPSDSISCVGSSRSKRSSASKQSKAKSSTSSSKHRSRAHSEVGIHYDKNDDIKSEPPLRRSARRGPSEAGTETTITPRNYKERSVTSLPIRNIAMPTTLLRG